MNDYSYKLIEKQSHEPLFLEIDGSFKNMSISLRIYTKLLQKSNIYWFCQNYNCPKLLTFQKFSIELV